MKHRLNTDWENTSGFYKKYSVFHLCFIRG